MKLLSFSNFVPEQIVDTVRFIHYQGTFRQSHYCPYVQDFLSQATEDPSVDGAVLPNSCDSARIALDYLWENHKYHYQLKHPIRRDAHGIRYFAQVIKEYKESLEGFFGKSISLELILERTDLLRKRGQYLYDLYNHLEDISYSPYIEHINRMLLSPLEEWETHTLLSCPPIGQR
jgi:benzoyl-CoA reductase/2-hydroxyglutaryl-CoA dehydratase subunit BcrC/BadD/HgdB